MINVQFSDDEETTIVSIFACEQDTDCYPNQRAVELSDTRYKSFYDALPDQIKSTMPMPEEVQN